MFAAADVAAVQVGGNGRTQRIVAREFDLADRDGQDPGSRTLSGASRQVDITRRVDRYGYYQRAVVVCSAAGSGSLCHG